MNKLTIYVAQGYMIAVEETEFGAHRTYLIEMIEGNMMKLHTHYNWKHAVGQGSFGQAYDFHYTDTVFNVIGGNRENTKVEYIIV